MLQAVCEVAELWWGVGGEEVALALGSDESGSLPVAVVVASDVVYDEEQLVPLGKTLATLVGPNTLCLLGFRNRTSASVIAKFFDGLKAQGFAIDTVAAEHLSPIYRANDAHVLQLTRK
jgi:hypothetical protein